MPPVKVTRLELSQLDDGRSRLVIEFGGEQRHTVEWYGELTADYLNPFQKAALVLDLHMEPRHALGGDIETGQHWARLTLSPPRTPDYRHPDW